MKTTLQYTVSDKDQLFTHVDHDTGEMLHFAASTMARFAEEYDAKEVMKGSISIIDAQVQHIMKVMGIEERRIERFTPEYRDKPIVGILWEDNALLIVDGNHRYIRRARDGFKNIRIHIFSYPFWKQFLVDIGADKEKMIEWIQTGDSGITDEESREATGFKTQAQHTLARLRWERMLLSSTHLSAIPI